MEILREKVVGRALVVSANMLSFGPAKDL